ncbi:MAG: hypothetical protein GY703_00670, partial [Gammaproteobacteria bacterium]|nr:hypothetical protein [Gammaproteobacteria bacterium]
SKYDANGNMLVPPIYPYYALPQTDSVISISTDGNGNVYALDLWNTQPKWRVYKFDPLLQYVYSVAVDPLTSEVAADLEGNFYATSWDLETGNYDAKLSKYTTNGTLACEATYDNDPTTMDRAYGIAIDEVGGIYVVGHGNNSYLTLKYDSDCNPVWSSPLIWEGEGYFSLASAIAVDSLGNLYVTGTVGGELIPSASQHDVATLKYTNLGAPPAIPLPDLAMTDASGPASATNGDSIVISNTVTNRGLDCDCANVPFPVGMYLSEDWMITTEDTLLGSRQVVDMLLRDEEDNQDTFVMIPDSVDYGSYYLGAVADSTNVIQEMAEYNNGHHGNQIFISRPLPDLVMLAASGPATAIRGQQISISDHLMNQGLDTGGPFTLGLYLSTDPIITTGDLLLGTREIGLLATGDEVSQDTFVTIPASLDVGLYYVGVIGDSYDAIAEWDETNNAMAGNAIRITLPAP